MPWNISLILILIKFAYILQNELDYANLISKSWYTVKRIAFYL